MTETPPKEPRWVEFDRLLGSMVREAAMLEIFLGVAAQHLCESRYGAVLVTGESSSRILRVCTTLIDIHTDIAEQKRTELKELLTQSRDLFEKRNEYVHGLALPGTHGGVVSIRTSRLKTEPKIGPVDIAALEKLSTDMRRLSDAVAAWNFEVYPDPRWR